MSSVSSINTVSSSGNRNYISGLASGMDTESIVQSLLSGTQSKIDKQTGLKQQLEWKQDIYRDLITKINTFNDQYFSFYSSADTNLTSQALFNSMTGASSSSAVRVVSAASNAASSINISSIERLATACTVTSKKGVTNSSGGGVSNLSGFANGENYSFSLSLDGISRTVSFQGGLDETETLKNINQALYRSFGTAVGMDKDAAGKMSLVKLEGDGSPSGTGLDGTRRVEISAIGADTETVKNLGFGSGFCNKLDYNTTLNMANFVTPLQGGRYEFTINGVEIKGLNGKSTIGDVINTINNSGAGVRVTYSSVSDKFVMESSSTGDIPDITMSQKYGNLLSTMFGVDASGAQSTSLRKGLTAGDTANLAGLQTSLNNNRDIALSMLVDGKSVTMVIPGSKDPDKYQSEDDVIAALNEKLDQNYGSGAIRFSVKDGVVTLRSEEHEVGFDDTTLANGIAKELGFAGDAGKINDILTDDSFLSDAGLTGKITVGGSSDPTDTFDLAGGGTVGDLVTWLHTKASKTESGTTVSSAVEYQDDGRLAITGIPEGIKLEGTGVKQLFGTDSVGSFKTAADTKAEVKPGQNAILTVNGIRTERNQNTFELDGITVELTETYNASAGSANPPIHLTTTRDTDKIVDSIKSFVDDYNKLIEELNEHISEEATYKKYPPLTDAQKKEMSDREVELWEEKSKQGLLHNDSNIESLLSSLRTTLYGSVDGVDIALYTIGIETSDSWRDNGKLILDEGKLRAAVETNAEQVGKLFTDPEQGIAMRLRDNIKSAANVSTGSPGSMVRYAGTKAVLVNDNTLYKEIKDIKETLSNLNRKYELERTRYWKQFNAMEQAISNMNSQSSWLAQQFSAQ